MEAEAGGFGLICGDASGNSSSMAATAVQQATQIQIPALPGVSTLTCASSTSTGHNQLIALTGKLIGLSLKDNCTADVSSWRAHCKGASFAGYPEQSGSLYHKHMGCLVESVTLLDGTPVLVGRAISVLGSFQDITRTMLTSQSGAMLPEAEAAHKQLLLSKMAAVPPTSSVCVEEGFIAISASEIRELIAIPGASLFQKQEIARFLSALGTGRTEAEDRDRIRRSQGDSFATQVGNVLLGGAMLLGLGGSALFIANKFMGEAAPNNIKRPASPSLPPSTDRTPTIPDGQAPGKKEPDSSATKASEKPGGISPKSGLQKGSNTKAESNQKQEKQGTAQVATPKEKAKPSAESAKNPPSSEKKKAESPDVVVARADSKKESKVGEMTQTPLKPELPQPQAAKHLASGFESISRFLEFHGDAAIPVDTSKVQQNILDVTRLKQGVESLRPFSLPQQKLVQAIDDLSQGEPTAARAEKFAAAVKAALADVAGMEPGKTDESERDKKREAVSALFAKQAQRLSEIFKAHGFAAPEIRGNNSQQIQATVAAFLGALPASDSAKPAAAPIRYTLKGLQDQGVTPLTLARLEKVVSWLQADLPKGEPDKTAAVEATAQLDGPMQAKLRDAAGAISDVLSAFGDTAPKADFSTLNRAYLAIDDYRRALLVLSPDGADRRALVKLTEDLLFDGLSPKNIDQFRSKIERVAAATKEASAAKERSSTRLSPREIQGRFAANMRILGGVLVTQGLREPELRTQRSREIMESVSAMHDAITQAGTIRASFGGDEILKALEILKARGVTQGSLEAYETFLDEKAGVSGTSALRVALDIGAALPWPRAEASETAAPDVTVLREIKPEKFFRSGAETLKASQAYVAEALEVLKSWGVSAPEASALDVDKPSESLNAIQALQAALKKDEGSTEIEDLMRRGNRLVSDWTRLKKQREQANLGEKTGSK